MLRPELYGGGERRAVGGLVVRQQAGGGGDVQRHAGDGEIDSDRAVGRNGSSKSNIRIPVAVVR